MKTTKSILSILMILLLSIGISSASLGSISYSSTPQGAEIWVNGINTGKTTPVVISEYTSGTYSITFKKNGYNDCTIPIITAIDHTSNAYCSLTLVTTYCPSLVAPPTSCPFGSVLITPLFNPALGCVPPPYCEVDSSMSCSADIQQCPDGSWVSRIPPLCEFKKCPSVLPPPSVSPTLSITDIIALILSWIKSLFGM